MNTAERAELTEKLRHAETFLRDAEDVRARIAAQLGPFDFPDHLPPLPWEADRLTIELQAADVRLDLWRGVVATLRQQLSAP